MTYFQDNCWTKHPSRRTLPTTGFSLIELLIVVSIIGLLVALALPALHYATRVAYSAGCTSRLHQMGTAILLYSSDHDQSLPGPLTGGQHCAYPVQFKYQLVSYLADYIPIKLVPGSNPPAADIMVCSAWRREIQDYSQGCPYEAYAGNVTLISGELRQPFGYPNWSDADKNTLPVKTMMIRDPSSVWALRDLDAVGTPSYAGRSYAPAKPVHGIVRNYLFFDGHVQAQSAY